MMRNEHVQNKENTDFEKGAILTTKRNNHPSLLNYLRKSRECVLNMTVKVHIRAVEGQYATRSNVKMTVRI